ncbi:MAG: rhomboid family intramembrane serine protease [Myxococcales bacterium]|nr:rhomboid family intramembrane serine protease [Myxococcales bacterium]
MSGPVETRSVGEWRGLKKELWRQGKILLGVVLALWLVEIADVLVFGGALDGYGIRPRSLSGLLGIALAPALHGGFRHLMANSVPLVVLGWFVMLRQTHDYFIVAAASTLIGGAGVWLIGDANSVHIGASIVVFGFLGYLLSRGYFERRFLPVVGSVIVGLMYGGALFGILPGQRGISWEGHLFGFLGGILAARAMSRRALPAQG